VITLDPGYKIQVPVLAKLLDGELGILRYRGYSIEDLAAKDIF
jgi:citrate synthase